ncbi:MAG: NAD(P)/FAD-dependent oxidoreductase, partial [Spirochaetota bacterium]
MKTYTYDAVIIGGGSAGIAAAAEISRNGHTAALIEREALFGGILNQCIHNGFGLHHYKEELTGPEYAQRSYDELAALPVTRHPGMTVTSIDVEAPQKAVYACSTTEGLCCFKTRAVVLAMGCRERNRGNIGIPGMRPAGVYTAGLAQRLVNIDGFIPGRECVIVGSGDIGLIMARRMTWVGARVNAVVEIQSYPAGLTRNIVQCLNDFRIPLYLSHVVSHIYGKDRVEGVDITPLEAGRELTDKAFHVPCDTLLLSVGLVPDNQLAKECGVAINPETNGAQVDANLMTSVDGIFACGNVLHVHDLVDFVTEESTRCGRFVSEYLSDTAARRQYRVVPASNV